MKKTVNKIFSLFLSIIILSGLLLPPVKAGAANASSRAGTVAVSRGSLNIRSSASVGAEIRGSLKKGSYVTLMSKSGSWWRVEYARGKYGYCHSDYIRTVDGTPHQVCTKGGNLNVRSGPGTSYRIQTTLPKGRTVILLSSSDGWSRILYNGVSTGYVSSTYLCKENPGVSLDVPDFKQTDSRWAGVEIGSSGKTIGKIGCATTAIAMMESFRTGETIYPHTMSKQLSYSSSGNVYWPSDYTVVTSSSDYLRKIYSLLKKGKPVLLGRKKASGGQHWVVVTGFTGGSLSASGFTINDPGSKTVKTLQQFISSYPVFYKYFHY